MKNFKLFYAYLAVFAMVFTSCSKDEMGSAIDSEKATLSFGAILEGMNTGRAAEKAHLDGFPECSDAAAAYVEIVLMQGGTEVVGTSEDPYRVDLAPGQNFTVEDAALELVPGNYSLEHFMVYSADGTLIWTAPINGSPMAGYVDTALPLNISLGAGVKKYVEVDVLCFDNRDVNEYGYLFFEVDQNRAIEFCIFGNYCDSTGRHFTAAYSVDVWSWSNGQMGAQLYDNLESDVTIDNNGDYTASPLCVALPDREGMDQYYFEITLMDADSYGDVENRIIRSGVVTDGEVKEFFNGANDVEYYHFRTGCENSDSVPLLQDPDSDAVVYKSVATSINNSGSYAYTYYVFDDNKLTATVLAGGVTPNKAHPQHIHGFTDGSDAVCPPASAAGADGLISLEEGAPFYGPVLVSLNYANGDFPVANSAGKYLYQRTFDMGVNDLPGPESLVTVVHGRMVDGEYVATLPVACGEVYEVE